MDSSPQAPLVHGILEQDTRWYIALESADPGLNPGLTAPPGPGSLVLLPGVVTVEQEEGRSGALKPVQPVAHHS